MKIKTKLQNSKIGEFVEQFTKKYPTKADVMNLEFELGIDEAGRGPVLGPMVYSALWWPKSLKEKLGSFGFEDSKALTEEQRNMLFSAIKQITNKVIFFEVQILHADLLSKKQQKFQAVNLNLISHNAAIKLLRSALSQGFKVTNVYVDTVGDPDRYREYIWSRIPDYKNVVQEIIVQSKADRDHKVVSASSICAKVTRDQAIKNWNFPQNIQFQGDYGCGYPSDPKTQQWLQRNKNKVFGFPNFIRFSWSTCTNILKDYCVMKMNEQTDQQKYRGLNGLKKKPVDLWQMIK